MSDCQGVLGYGMFSLQQSKSSGAILTLSQRMTSKELLVSFAGSLEGTMIFFACRYYLTSFSSLSLNLFDPSSFTLIL